jgi:hypothetical protein
MSLGIGATSVDADHMWASQMKTLNTFLPANLEQIYSIQLVISQHSSHGI